MTILLSIAYVSFFLRRPRLFIARSIAARRLHVAAFRAY